MFFYELHEGDNEVYADVLVVSESEWEPQEFFELVQSIRRRIQGQFHQDTLAEGPPPVTWTATLRARGIVLARAVPDTTAWREPRSERRGRRSPSP